MDGWITIGTELSTDKFDKQIIELERKISKEEEKKIEIEAKLDSQKQELEQAIQKTDELADAYQRLKTIQEAIANRNATLEQFQTFQSIKDTYGDLNQIGNQFEKALTAQERLSHKVSETENKYASINSKVSEYKAKIERINLQKQLAEAERTKTSFKGWGEALSTAVSKITRIGLAIFSVRSAYTAIRQTISTLSQYDDGLTQKLEAIKLTLASALAPVVEFIVNLITKAVALLGYVLKTLFGIDIFAKASAMSMKKATSSARELRKQLAGFDEMNVLNDSGTSGVLGGLGTTIQDMSEMGEGVFKDLRKWFLGSDKEDFWGIWNDNMEIIKKFDQNVRTTLKPLAEWVYQNAFKPLKDKFDTLMKELEPLIEPVKKAFEQVVEDVKPYWENFVGFVKENVVNPATDAFKPIGVKIHDALVPWANKIIALINKVFGVFGVELEYWEYETEETGENVGENLTNPLEQTENKIDELNQNEINIQTDTTNIENLDNGIGGILDKLWQLVSKPWQIVTNIVTEGSKSLNNFLQPLRDGLSSVGLQLPLLATGGIINMPNRGTMIGGAIAGESGREGVIPLTDSQAMADLGREIGKNVMVNLTNITSMNGRIISRELKQVQNEQEFAYNM